MELETIENQDENKCEERDTNFHENFNTKTFASFFRLFTLIGITINHSKSSFKRCSCCRCFPLIFLSIIGLLNFSLHIYVLLLHNFWENFYYIGNTDYFIIFCVVHFLLYRRQQVNAVVNDLMSLLSRHSTDISTVKKSIKKWIYFCYVIAFLQFIMEMSDNIISISVGILNGAIDFLIVICAVTLVKGPQVLCSDIFSAFVIFNLILIHQCWQQLNEKFKKQEKRDFKSYLNKYMKLANTTQRFNQIFSPALLILVIVNIIQIVTTADEVISEAKGSTISITFIPNSFRLFITLVTFFTITCFGQKIKSQAQTGIDILLETSINDTDHAVINDEEEKNKNITSQLLFASKMASSPVVINASNLIVIDCNMIPIIISTAITYLTIVSTSRDSTSSCSASCIKTIYECPNSSIKNETYSTATTDNFI